MTHQVRRDVFWCYLVQYSVQYVAIKLSSGHRVISVGGGGGGGGNLYMAVKLYKQIWEINDQVHL